MIEKGFGKRYLWVTLLLVLDGLRPAETAVEINIR